MTESIGTPFSLSLLQFPDVATYGIPKLDAIAKERAASLKFIECLDSNTTMEVLNQTVNSLVSLFTDGNTTKSVFPLILKTVTLKLMSKDMCKL